MVGEDNIEDCYNIVQKCDRAGHKSWECVVRCEKAMEYCWKNIRKPFLADEDRYSLGIIALFVTV